LTSGWITLALLFNLAIYYTRGPEDAIKFFTGYLIEYSLSVDNLFVFLLIFSYFKVPRQYVHKVLFWGILSAIVLRMLFILFGIALIDNFSWMIYVFGALLIYTAFKLILTGQEEGDLEANLVVRFFKKICPVTHSYDNGHFFTQVDNRKVATPLFLALLVVNTIDVVFAIDSIPAILGITTDIVLVYTSNIFAVLGLRSLYFALEGMMRLFTYLHYALAIILAFIGIKMLISGIYHIPIGVTLGFIFITLGTSIALSLVFSRAKPK
jgi:tellurite resistance protein TerC